MGWRLVPGGVGHSWRGKRRWFIRHKWWPGNWHRKGRGTKGKKKVLQLGPQMKLSLNINFGQRLIIWRDKPLLPLRRQLSNEFSNEKGLRLAVLSEYQCIRGIKVSLKCGTNGLAVAGEGRRLREVRGRCCCLWRSFLPKGSVGIETHTGHRVFWTYCLFSEISLHRRH